MSLAKENILSRLRVTPSNKLGKTKPFKWRNNSASTNDTEQLILKLEENHAEVHPVTLANWKEKFIDILEKENATHCLLGQNLDYQNELVQTLSIECKGVKITRFDKRYERLKESLFHDIDISLTLAQAAISETGTLVLIPDENEPRTMSLIPPIHVVLLQQTQIVESMSKLLESPPWQKHEVIPSNILFISSPSKTADIQQTLAYGAHGPKKLIVLVLD